MEKDKKESIENSAMENLNNNNNTNKSIITKTVITIIIVLIIIIGGKFIYNKFNDDDSINNVRKILKAKYTDVKCINNNCDGFIVIDGDKLSKYKVLLYNLDGKKIADYNVNYNSSDKTTQSPIQLGSDYYISTVVNTSNLNIEKYSIKDKKSRTLYETKNKLEVLNNNYVLMTDENDKYTILTKKGKTIYENLSDIDYYLDGKYIQIKVNDIYSILNDKLEKIFDNYRISKVVNDESGKAIFLIVENVKENVYNYFNINKNKVIGDSFSSYSQNDESSQFTIVKNENNKMVKYILYDDGKQEKIEDDLDKYEEKIKDKIDTNKYKIYDDSIYSSKQKYILVDDINNKSFGILNVDKNEFKSLYNYKEDRTIFYSLVSRLQSNDDLSYVKITCSEYNCNDEKTIIYDLNKNKTLYETSGNLTITSYYGYEDGYKVIRFDSVSDDKYDNKYVVYDKNNKELLVNDNFVVIVDKKLIIGKNSGYSLSLYSVRKNKILNKEIVSSISVGNKTLYKYKDDDDNVIIINSEGQEIIKVNDDNYFKLSSSSYVYLEDNNIKFYNIEKDKTYDYKLKDNERINTLSGNIIDPYRNAMFINNSTDKYIKVINFKGKQIDKIKDVEISSVKVNNKNKKAYIIVRKSTEKGDYYGLYVVE